LPFLLSFSRTVVVDFSLFFLHPLSACSLPLKFGMGSAAPAKG
jgi:hypothetical protein